MVYSSRISSVWTFDREYSIKTNTKRQGLGDPFTEGGIILAVIYAILGKTKNHVEGGGLANPLDLFAALQFRS